MTSSVNVSQIELCLQQNDECCSVFTSLLSVLEHMHCMLLQGRVRGGGVGGGGLGDEKLSIPSQIGMDLSRITTCMSPCAELHRSSQPCDQWSSDGDDQLISILITGTAAVAVYCTLLAERLRIRICWRSAPVICTSPHYKLCVILLTNLWLNCSVGLKPAGLLLRVGLKNYINIYMQIYLY